MLEHFSYERSRWVDGVGRSRTLTFRTPSPPITQNLSVSSFVSSRLDSCKLRHAFGVREQWRTKGVYKDMQTAAFEMMDALRPLTADAEYGGSICRNGPGSTPVRSTTPSAALVLAATVAGLGLGGCLNSQDVPEPSLAVATRSVCEGEPVNYFGLDAERVVAPRAAASDWDFIAQYLVIMKQPSLFCGNAPDEGYRLTSLYSTGRPTFISVQRTGRAATVSWMQLGAPSWAVSTRVLSEGSRPITDVQWRRVAETISKIGFWHMRRLESTEEWAGPSTGWVLEGRKKHLYHVVRRGEPRAGSIAEVATNLLRLANVPEESLSAPP
jgi:hypothetical protein